MPTAEKQAEILGYLDEKGGFDILDRVSAKEPTLTLTELLALWRQTPKPMRKGRPVEPGEEERMLYVREQLSGVDLDKLVDQWAQTPDLSEAYEEQVRRFIPSGTPFKPIDYNAADMKKWLVSQGLSVCTQRKYRAAFGSFGTFLVESKVLESNPAKSVSLPKLARHDPVYLEEDQAKRLIASLPIDQAALEALMYGSGIEWQAAARLRKADFDIPRRMLLANGTKTAKKGSWRKRYIEVTEDWCWEYVMRWLNTLAPSAPFVRKNHRSALKMHQKYCVDLGISVDETDSTLHQYRHAFTVMWLNRGVRGGMREDKRDLLWLKNQLGHSPQSNLIDTTYGVEDRRYTLMTRIDERLANSATRPHDRPQLAAMK